MKQLLGILAVLGGVALAIYLAFWVCFIGGIVGLIEAVKAPVVSGGDIAFNLLKILFSGAVGQIMIAITVAFGGLFVQK